MIKKFFNVFGVDSDSGAFSNNFKFTSGGTNSADPNTLDRYDEATYAHTLTFGGASVGLTSVSMGGAYTEVGNLVFYTSSIILTSKGSSVGNILISGLPFTVTTLSHSPSSIFMRNVAIGLGDTAVVALALANTTTIELYKYSLGQPVKLTDADITDTTEFRITGFYSKN